jgi:hypothetical protein
MGKRMGTFIFRCMVSRWFHEGPCWMSFPTGWKLVLRNRLAETAWMDRLVVED